jgi:O-antigen ligase
MKMNSSTKKARVRSVSTKRTLGSMLMAFEAFVVLFATLVAFGLKAADTTVVWVVGLALALLLIATPAVLGKRGSYVWGTILQVGIVLTGIWVPLMWILGGILLCLWAWALIAGSTIDKARANYLKLQAAADEVVEILTDESN